MDMMNEFLASKFKKETDNFSDKVHKKVQHETALVSLLPHHFLLRLQNIRHYL